MKAPPRSTLAPARLTAAAEASTCSSLSAEQGPAMTITSSPPMRTSPTLTTVFSGLKVRPASLYGSVIRTTSWTPSNTSRSRVSNWRLPPTAPSTVRSAPVDRCTSNPICVNCAITCCTCSSVARSCITTTMSSPLPLACTFVAGVLDLGFPFEPPRLVDDALEQPLDRGVVQRTRIDALDV